VNVEEDYHVRVKLIYLSKPIFNKMSIIQDELEIKRLFHKAFDYTLAKNYDEGWTTLSLITGRIFDTGLFLAYNYMQGFYHKTGYGGCEKNIDKANSYFSIHSEISNDMIKSISTSKSMDTIDKAHFMKSAVSTLYYGKLVTQLPILNNMI
jgi:hypothetical protein